MHWGNGNRLVWTLGLSWLSAAVALAAPGGKAGWPPVRPLQKPKPSASKGMGTLQRSSSSIKYGTPTPNPSAQAPSPPPAQLFPGPNSEAQPGSKPFIRLPSFEFPDPPGKNGKKDDVTSNAVMSSKIPPQRVLDQYFTDVVALGHGDSYHCTGILVASQVVLTARHCLPVSQVVLGVSTESPDSVLTVQRTIESDDATLDAALLVLNQRLTLPIRSRRSENQVAAPIGMLRVVGFGATDSAGQKGFGRKRMADIPAQGWGCDEYRARWSGCEPGLELVLSHRGGRDTCDGDSGGPVLEQTAKGWRLLAITSRPLARARSRCGEGGVYVRVDQLAPWLNVQLASIQSTEVSNSKEQRP